MPQSAKTKANRKAYDALPKVKKARAARNKARRECLKSGSCKKGDGKDVMHTGSFGKGSTKVGSRKANRAEGGARGGRRSSGGGRPKGS